MGGEDDKIIRIPGETLSIKVSPEEEAYRKKYLPDAKKLTDEKLVCTVCSVSLAQNIHKGKDIYVHRALQVLVCEACYNFYGDGSFSVDEDGDDKYCRWCGQGGTLYICAACNCAFCQKCTKQNLKASVLAELENDDWKCYICNPRPLFGCRTICWGAQQLNAVGKEKEAERLKKIKERLEKLEAKKKEANERKSRKNSSSEDEALTKKRKRSSDGDSSSPEVMPKRKKREARASRNLNGSIGRRKKDVTSGSESEEEKKTTRRSRTSNIKEKVQSSSEDESDNKSKKDKTKKKKKRRDDSDDSSDTSKKKSKRKSVKKTTDDDSSEEEEKIRKKKNKKKAKKKKETSSDSSSESSSERHRKKNKKTPKKRLENSSDSSDEDESSKSHKKTKRKPDKDGSLKKQENVDSDNEPKKGKRVTTDSEDVPVSTNSAEDILVKKRIKLAILWLTTIVKDISELGTLISLRATNFSKKKINTENLKSYEDVLNCVSKIKQLISGVHSNYVHIEKTLDSHLKPWKILTGLEDAENEKTIGSESSVSNDRNVSKADNKDRGINGTPEESKEKNNKEDNMNNWSDDSDEQNETRALISKANEALDKSQIEDEQSETIKEDHKDEKSETAKTDNEEESKVVGDVKKEKEATKSPKIDSVKPDSESKLQSPKKSPLKDKKDAVPDNESEERSPKKSSSVKKNCNEDKCDEKSKEDKEEPCKEEMETEG